MTGRASTPVEIQCGDHTLRGLQWAGSTAWLLLVHDRDGVADLDGWRPLLPALSQADWSILAIDRLGHGASDGDDAEAATDADLRATIEFARGQGATWLAVLGAGRTALDLLALAAETDLDALVLLSPSGDGEDLSNLRGRGEAKLFVVGSEDSALRESAALLRNRSIGWAVLVNVPAGDQGTNLLSGGLGTQVRERIVAFLTEQRFIAKTRGVAAQR